MIKKPGSCSRCKNPRDTSPAKDAICHNYNKIHVDEMTAGLDATFLNTVSVIQGPHLLEGTEISYWCCSVQGVHEKVLK